MITKKDVGKRVVVNGMVDLGISFDNERGEIIGFADSYPQIGIKFDRKIPGLHTCSIIDRYTGCKPGHGYFVNEENITFEKGQKMTGIRIETEKIVESDGELSRKITGIKALTTDKLPRMYLDGVRPICFVGTHNALYVENKTEDFSDRCFKINEIVPEETFQQLLSHCHAAGDHLMEVNRELARKKAGWQGKETFII